MTQRTTDQSILIRLLESQQEQTEKLTRIETKLESLPPLKAAVDSLEHDRTRVKTLIGVMYGAFGVACTVVGWLVSR